MMQFCYDLAVELCSFDFFGWLVQAKAAGATEITFDTRGLRPELRRRYETILLPGPALAGLPCREGRDGERLPPGSSRMGALVRFARENIVPRLRSVIPPGGARYTVTLRRQCYGVHRNSDETAWRTFAVEVGARVIPDWDDEPIHLHERMALYAGADLNLGILCGPLVLCTLTSYPVLALGAGRDKDALVFAKYGVTHGSNPPWCLANQYVLWGEDDLPAIRRAFERWRNEWQSPRT